jgi:hypothetical protein
MKWPKVNWSNVLYYILFITAVFAALIAHDLLAMVPNFTP